MTVNPFPEIKNRMELDSIPSRGWIECVNCIESQDVTDGRDPDEWALEHSALYPSHQRYRIVSQVNFRVVPSGVAPSGFVGERTP